MSVTVGGYGTVPLTGSMLGLTLRVQVRSKGLGIKTDGSDHPFTPFRPILSPHARQQPVVLG